MKTFIIVLCAIPFLMSLFVDNASACTCGVVTVAEYRNSAKAVFMAKVVSKRKSNALGKDDVEVTLMVERVWKGKISVRTVVFTGPTEDLYTFLDLCATPFKVGEKYIVFAYGEDKLSTNVCTGTGGFPYADKVITQLGRGRLPLKTKS